MTSLRFFVFVLAHWAFASTNLFHFSVWCLRHSLVFLIVFFVSLGATSRLWMVISLSISRSTLWVILFNLKTFWSRLVILLLRSFVSLLQWNLARLLHWWRLWPCVLASIITLRDFVVATLFCGQTLMITWINRGWLVTLVCSMSGLRIASRSILWLCELWVVFHLCCLFKLMR